MNVLVGIALVVGSYALIALLFAFGIMLDAYPALRKFEIRGRVLVKTAIMWPFVFIYLILSVKE